MKCVRKEVVGFAAPMYCVGFFMIYLFDAFLVDHTVLPDQFQSFPLRSVWRLVVDTWQRFY
jgi:hypothetical protein